MAVIISISNNYRNLSDASCQLFTSVYITRVRINIQAGTPRRDLRSIDWTLRQCMHADCNSAWNLL